MRFTRLLIAGVLTATVGACADDSSAAPAPAPATSSAASSSPVTSSTPETPATTATTGQAATPRPAGTTKKPSGGGATTAKSDLSQLKALGIDVEAAVILDVADDGVDRWMQIGKGGVVDFTGTSRTDSTMMSLKAAAVSARNRVTIKPPFYNEDLGAGSCVADTSGAALKLETCQAGKASQTWQVVPAGDSGQFELRGAFGILSVDNGKLTTGGGGRTGLQTLEFAG